MESNSTENITITVKEYRELRKAEARLAMLDGGGVDNWEGYGMSLFEGEVTLAQVEADIDAEIKAKLASGASHA